MLGEQIGEVNGKVTSQRVLDVEEPTLETSLTASGIFRGIHIEEKLTFVGRPQSQGVLHGFGKGILWSGNGETATVTGEGIGKVSSSGNVSWRGSLFFRTSSVNKIAFLNNMVAVFEAEIDSSGNFNEKTWEWK